MAQKERKNKIDTEKEYKGEVSESFEDISAVIKEYHFSLSTKVVDKIIDSLSDDVLLKILHQLSEYAPDDLEAFISKVNKLFSNDSSHIKTIIRSLALTGELPEKYMTDEIKNFFSKEVFKNDPEDIQILNKLEIDFQIQALRFRTQKLLIKYLPKNYRSKYDLKFYDLNISKEESELLEKQKTASKTSSLLDDYIIEFKLGQTRDYEPEELIYLGKKIINIAKKEGRAIPDEILSHTKHLIEKYKENFFYLENELTLNSVDSFSFHQVRLMGSNYNFAYFGSTAQRNEFHKLPKLDDRPVLVLLHGLAQSWACWRWVIGLLKYRYQILVPDMNGFGDSSELVLFHNLSNFSNYIANFLLHLGVKKYDLMGHSAGGFTVQQIVESSKLKPEHAVMMSSAPYISLSFLATAVTLFLRTSTAKRWYANLFFRYMGILSVKLKYPLMIYSPEEKLRRLKKSSPRTLAELVENLTKEYNITKKKIKTSTKCLVVYGSDDLFIPAHTSKKLVSIFEGAEVLEIPGVAHAEVLRALPTTYSSLLLKFLQS